MTSKKPNDELEMKFMWREIIKIAAEIGMGESLAEELLVRRGVSRERAK